MPSDIEIVNTYGRPKLFKDRPAGDLYKAGMWMLGHLFGRQDAKEWCAANNLASVWLDKNFTPVRNTANEKTNTNGGFLVPTVLENMIIDLREQYGVFRGIARSMPMSSDSVSIPRRIGGLTAYPIGESTAPTASTKAWGKVDLTAKKWGVLTKYTTEIAEDAIIAIAEDLTKEIAYAFSVSEDDAGFNGDGTSTYAGILGILTKFQNQVSAGASTLAGALDAASGHDTFAEIDNTDLTNLMAKLPKYAEGNACLVLLSASMAVRVQSTRCSCRWKHSRHARERKAAIAVSRLSSHCQPEDAHGAD
jgi:HK97 family phage major capsid protein